MSDYRHGYIPGGHWFFTVNLQNRHSNLLIRHTTHPRTATVFVKSKKPSLINAWMVLPEHICCTWALPEGGTNCSSRQRDIKKMFTQTLTQCHTWQPRFWEHATRSEEDYRWHMDYVCINLVKYGHIHRVQDRPYSAFHHDVCRVWYPPDWAGEISEFDADER